MGSPCYLHDHRVGLDDDVVDISPSALRSITQGYNTIIHPLTTHRLYGATLSPYRNPQTDFCLSSSQLKTSLRGSCGVHSTIELLG